MVGHFQSGSPFITLLTVGHPDPTIHREDPYLVLKVKNSIFSMFRHYLTAAFRILRHQKAITFINLFGMSLGVSCSILLLLYTIQEMSIDQFQKVDRKYRLELQQISDQSPKWAINHISWSKNYADEIKQIEYAVPVMNYGDMVKMSVGDKAFYESEALISTPEIVDFLELQILRAQADDPLGAPNRVIISEAYARKYFQNDDPLGQEILVDDQYRFIVTGIFNYATPSHIDTDMFFAYDEKIHHYSWIHLYLQLHPNQDLQKVKEDINNISIELSRPFYNDTEYALVSMEDVYFNSTSKYQFSNGGNLMVVRILGIIGLFILIVAAINFVNLSAASFLKRTKEIGLRKVLGASKAQVFLRFLAESSVMMLFVSLISIGLLYMALPHINQELGVELSLAGMPFILPLLLIGALMLLALVTSMVPGLYIHQLRITKAIRSKKGKGSKEILVISQFAISIIMIIGTLLVKDQLSLIRDKDLGYGEDQILMVHIYDYQRPSTSYIPRFERNSGVLSATTIMGAPGDGNMMGNQNAWGEGMAPGENMFLPLYAGGENLLKTMGWEILQGRDFSEGVAMGDSIRSIIVNEAAVRAFDWDDPIGKRMVISGGQWRVVGVVKDFHFLSLHHEIGPLGIQYQHDNYMMALRLNSRNMDATMDHIKQVWSEIDNTKPLNSFFLDENFDKQYLSEKRLDVILGILMFISLVISAIGTLGMVIILMDEKTKEIGIRKVLGATVSQILFLLNQKMLRNLLIANVIAWPIAYWAINHWLESFAHRVIPNVWVFLLAGGLSVVLALLALGYHSIKTAQTNPAIILKDE